MKLLNITDYFDRLLDYRSTTPIDKSNYRYDKHECEREIFVRRSLNSYRGKYFVLYEKKVLYSIYQKPTSSTEVNYLLKKYIQVHNLSYYNSSNELGYKITVIYSDASDPIKPKSIDLDECSIKELIGRESTKEEYTQVAELFTCDLTEEEYTVYAYDWSKALPKGHSKKNLERAKMIFTISGRTEDEAYDKARKYCKGHKIDFHYLTKI